MGGRCIVTLLPGTTVLLSGPIPADWYAMLGQDYVSSGPDGAWFTENRVALIIDDCTA